MRKLIVSSLVALSLGACADVEGTYRIEAVGGNQFMIYDANAETELFPAMTLYCAKRGQIRAESKLVRMGGSRTTYFSSVSTLPTRQCRGYSTV